MKDPSNLRLTLRTLLAYLDDTLEPSQAKLIGQKVAESETAQELIARIKQVTRRRRITTPPPTGPGARIDPNTIAEYLDNVLPTEQLGEVEQVALASDVHLAEIAACHQILTLVLGEPALVPPTARQRMYGLVKGPEAIPFRKPPTREMEEGEHAPHQVHEDETLRLGLPPLNRNTSWKNRLTMVGGGLAVALLLGLALWQVLNLGSRDKDKPGPGPLAKVNETEGKEKEKKDDSETLKPMPKVETPPVLPEKKEEPKEPVKKDEPPPEPMKEPEKPATVPDVPAGPPSEAQAVIAHFLTPPAGDSSIVFQASPDRSEWKRVDLKRPDVYSGRPLVSLPGSRGSVQLKKGVRVTLWGSFRELVPAPPLNESLVELHQHDALDADLTLRRGRVVLTNVRTDNKPVQVRVRFENPTQPNPDGKGERMEHLDLTLMEKGSEVMIDRWNSFARNEPFYKDPKDARRIGPVSDMGIIVINGNVQLKANDLTFGLQPPPGPCVILWSSVKGLAGPHVLPKLPDFTSTNPPLPQGLDQRIRSEMLRSRDDLSVSLGGRALDVTLAGDVKSADPFKRKLAVLSFAAVDDPASLVDALDQDKFPDVRLASIDALRQWMTSNRDNEYRLYDLLKTKYRLGEVENIMKLLHYFTEKEASQPETYETLIDYLTNPLLVVRELAAWHLYRLVPAGQQIPWDSAGDPATRERTRAQWRTLIPAGQLPPMAAPKKAS